MDLKVEELKSFFETYLAGDTQVLGNSLPAWATSLVLVFVIFFLLQTVKAILKRRARLFNFAKIPHVDDLIVGLVKKTKNYFLFLLAVVAGTQILEFDTRIRSLLHSVTLLVGLLQLFKWGNFLIEFWVTGYAAGSAEDDASRATTVRFAGILLRLVFASCIFLLALDNLGVDVTTLVAGLGVGGIAIGLAAQNILGDLFASLSIVLDKPFVLGDFIVLGDDSGTIERIGIKTTRVRRLTGEMLIVPNSALVNSRVRNFKRMDERRIVFAFGVLYQTTPTKLRKIPSIVKEIIGGVEKAREDRVHFLKFGESSLDFEVVYFVTTAEYNDYMDAQQEINLKLFERFALEGIEFAYPTRTLFIESGGEDEEKSPFAAAPSAASPA